jgi:hypothetical protein
VIAGYTPSAKNFDAIIFGYFEGGELIYAGPVFPRSLLVILI